MVGASIFVKLQRLLYQSTRAVWYGNIHTNADGHFWCLWTSSTQPSQYLYPRHSRDKGCNEPSFCIMRRCGSLAERFEHLPCIMGPNSSWSLLRRPRFIHTKSPNSFAQYKRHIHSRTTIYWVFISQIPVKIPKLLRKRSWFAVFG